MECHLTSVILEIGSNTKELDFLCNFWKPFWKTFLAHSQITTPYTHQNLLHYLPKPLDKHFINRTLVKTNIYGDPLTTKYSHEKLPFPGPDVLYVLPEISHKSVYAWAQRSCEIILSLSP